MHATAAPAITDHSVMELHYTGKQLQPNACGVSAAAAAQS